MRISVISLVAVLYATLSFAAPLAIPADGLSQRSYDDELSVLDRRQLEQAVPREIIPVVAERSLDVETSVLESRQRSPSPPPPYSPGGSPPPYSPPRSPPPAYSPPPPTRRRTI